MEMEKSKVLIEFLLIFRQSGDVLFFLYARRLRGYTATTPLIIYHGTALHPKPFLCKTRNMNLHESPGSMDGLSKNPLHPMGEIAEQEALHLDFVFSSAKM